MKSYLVAALGLTALLAGCTSTPTTPAATKPAPTKPAAAAKTRATPAMPNATIKSTDMAAPSSQSSTTSMTVNLPQSDLPAPKLSLEARALVERLTQSTSSNSAHEIADTTGFPEALVSLQQGVRAPKIETTVDMSGLPPPKGLTADGNSTELIERDWTGLVLVPISTSLSKAYTTEVRLLKTEAHPLHDGRVRVWTRVQNLGQRPLATDIACSFRMSGEKTPNSPYFYELIVPPGSFRDVFFVSADGELSAYTVLVRNAEIVRRP